MSAKAEVDHTRPGPETGTPPPQVGVPARYVADGKVVEGRAGRLFLANDDNHAFEQFTGERALEDWKLEFWGKVLARRVRILRGLGIPYHFLVAPDSHPVYPELLPPGVEAAAERPIEQLMGYVERHDIGLPFIYPLEDLKQEERRGGVVYPETDTHWNDLGGWVAYESLMAGIEPTLPVRRLTRRHVLFQDITVPGDLGYKLDPVRSSPYATAFVRTPSARLLEDNKIESTGGLVITECPAAPPVTCVLLGDSYTYALLKFLSESFGRLVFGHTPWMDLDLIDRERPAVVISLMVERHLVGVPNDVEGETLEQSAARKTARHRTRPRLEHWDEGPGVVSPGNVERVRRHLLARGRLLDATVVSVLAYAGLRPREVVSLRWSHVGEHTLDLAGARTVPLVKPLARDLREWRNTQNPANQDARVFPRLAARGASDLRRWRSEVLVPAFEACDVPEAGANALHRTFAALMLHGGAPAREVARQTDIPAGEFDAEFEVVIGRAMQGEPVPPDELIMLEREARYSSGRLR